MSPDWPPAECHLSQRDACPQEKAGHPVWTDEERPGEGPKEGAAAHLPWEPLSS